MTRRSRIACGVLAAVAAAGGLAACEPPPPPTSFVVNSSGDGSDAVPGDGVCAVDQAQNCTLRAAIEEGNALGGPIEITFDPSVSATSLAQGDLVVTNDTTIDGNGAHVDLRLQHEAGTLTLRDMRVPGPINSGCDDSDPDPTLALVLDRVIFGSEFETHTDTALCAGGGLTIIRSQLDTGSATGEPGVVAHGPVVLHGVALWSAGGPAVRIVGPGPYVVSSSVVMADGDPGIDAGSASGRIGFSMVQGTFGDDVEVGASLIECTSTTTLGTTGHNFDVFGRCGLDDRTDQVADAEIRRTLALDLSTWPIQFPPEVGSPAVGAIPAGTPGLCDGSWPLDSRNEPRRGDRACDIGPFQTQVSVEVDGGESSRPVVHERPVRVNASGTVAATFPDGSGGSSAGRWFADGSFESADVPGSEAADISDDGVVVGRTWVVDHFEPWRWDTDGAATIVVGPAGTTSGELLAIDDVDGTVIGLSQGTEPVLWYQAPDGPVVPLPTPPGARIEAVHAGTAVGVREHPTGTSAVTWDLPTGSLTDLPFRNADSGAPSTATDIASDGSVVGFSDGPTRWSPEGTPMSVGIGFHQEQVEATTSAGDLLIGPANDPFNCDVHCETATIVPAGTQEHRMLSVGFFTRDLGDDGTLVGVRFTAGSPPSAEVVRIHLAIGD